jgi:sirohydrochlorin ferrochelatase
MTGYLVFAHGSSVESANEAVRAVTAQLAELGGYGLIETAFLEGGKPDLKAGVSRLLERGARRIVVLPYFLTLGLHLKRDLPALIAQARESFPQLEDIAVTEPLDGHPALARILLERAQSAC